MAITNVDKLPNVTNHIASTHDIKNNRTWSNKKFYCI